MANMKDILEAALASKRPAPRAQTKGPVWTGRPAPRSWFETRCLPPRLIPARMVASHRRDHPREPRPTRVL